MARDSYHEWRQQRACEYKINDYTEFSQSVNQLLEVGVATSLTQCLYKVSQGIVTEYIVLLYARERRVMEGGWGGYGVRECIS